MRIFLVDDDNINRKLLHTVLSREGFTNLEMFSCGEDLLRTCDTCVPDLILLDIMMPGLSGYDAITLVRDTRGCESLPIIMITAVALEDDMEPLRRSFELGAMDYISKPISNIELVMRVRSALRIERQRQLLEAAAKKINSLEKLLPICSYCKKVRDDNDYWHDVEVYISERTDSQFSHSVCPDCYNTHIKPQLDQIKNKE
jgi:DNA-binding response OmpR family regulator